MRAASVKVPIALLAALPVLASLPDRRAKAEPLGLPTMVVATQQTQVWSRSSPPVRLAWPAAGVPLEVKEALPTGELVVQIHGGIETTGVVSRRELGVVVCEPGPLGDRFYVGRGNVLELRSESAPSGQVEVAGQVTLLKNPSSYSGEKDYSRSVPLSGPIEVRRLCSAPLRKHAGTDKDPDVAHVLGQPREGDFPAGTAFVEIAKNVALSFLESPGGAPVHTRLPDRWGYSLPRLAHQGRWDRVAVGEGPYLLAWIPARPGRRPPPVGGLDLAMLSASQPAPFSLYTDSLRRWPLHELKAGTELRQRGEVVARLSGPGYARVTEQREGFQYAVVAVDDEVVAEGWLDRAQLGAKVKEAPAR